MMRKPDPIAPDNLSPGIRAAQGSKLTDRRRKWIIEQKALGYSNRSIGRALKLAENSIRHALEAAASQKPKRVCNNAAAVEAARSVNRAKFRAMRDGPKNGYFYADLHAQGLTATEAARLRGQAPQTARQWAKDHGVEWVDGWSVNPNTKKRDSSSVLNSKESIEKRAKSMRLRNADPSNNRLANMTADERRAYDLARWNRLDPDEAAIAAGRPDLTRTEWRRTQIRQQLKEALATATPEEIMLARAAVMKQTRAAQPQGNTP